MMTAVEQPTRRRLGPVRKPALVVVVLAASSCGQLIEHQQTAEPLTPLITALPATTTTTPKPNESTTTTSTTIYLPPQTTMYAPGTEFEITVEQFTELFGFPPPTS